MSVGTEQTEQIVFVVEKSKIQFPLGKDSGKTNPFYSSFSCEFVCLEGSLGSLPLTFGNKTYLSFKTPLDNL